MYVSERAHEKSIHMLSSKWKIGCGEFYMTESNDIWNLRIFFICKHMQTQYYILSILELLILSSRFQWLYESYIHKYYFLTVLFSNINNWSGTIKDPNIKESLDWIALFLKTATQWEECLKHRFWRYVWFRDHWGTWVPVRFPLGQKSFS